MSKAPPGVHPKWISLFGPDSTYVYDDGTPDPQVPDDEFLVQIRREGELIAEETYTQRTLGDILTELGV